MKKFNKKTVIITGGASGIGHALAAKLAGYGAKVIAADIVPIEGLGSQVETHRLDVTKPQEFKDLVEQVVQKYDRLDYIFNNAGVGMGGEVAHMTVEDWQRVVAVNLWGVIHGIQAAYPLMVRQGCGHIVNTASLAGLVPSPSLIAYSTTKHAVAGLSRGLRTEAAGYGVKVTALCPGFIRTNIFENGTYVNTSKEEALNLITQTIGLVELDTAVDLILQGVARNKALVVFPRYARLLWWTDRLSPQLGEWLGNRFISQTRKRSAGAP